MISIEGIVAYDKYRGISKNGKMPWNIPEEMKFFKEITIKNVVIMGKNTFVSLNNKPLKDRLNVVITKKPEIYYKCASEYSNIIFTDNENIHLDIIRNSNEYANRFYFLNKHFKIFYMGGEQMYKKFIPICSTVWVTKIKDNYDCDLFFSLDVDNDSGFISESVKTSIEFDIIKYTKNSNSMFPVVDLFF
jgi:dihydrofolate reductase